MSIARRVATALVLAFVILAAGIVAGNTTRVAEAGPLAGSTWCAHRDSMAIFGGSSATGYLTTGYSSSTGTYAPTQYGWWQQITAFAATNWGTTSHNYARNGASFKSYTNEGQWPVTRNAVSQLGEVQPDLLFLSLGANEYLAQRDPAEMEANMRSVVAAVKQASPRTAIMAIIQQTAVVPDTSASNPPTWSWEKYKVRIMQVVIDEHLAMADLRQSVPSAYGPDRAKFYHPDGIHMLDTAQVTFAAGVRPWLYFC